MAKSGDWALGIALVVVLGAYWLVTQPSATETATEPSTEQAVEQGGETHPLPTQLDTLNTLFNQVASSGPQFHNMFRAKLQQQDTVAMVVQHDAPWIWPNVDHTDVGNFVGGCPLSDDKWVMLMMNGSTLTQLPKLWPSAPVELCFDSNGSKGPNALKKDVVWVTFSPHTTPMLQLKEDS